MAHSTGPQPAETGPEAAWKGERLLFGGAFVAAVTAITSLFNLLILAAIGRELGASALGVFGVASAVGTYVFVLGAFGTSQIVTRDLAQGEGSGKDLLALLATRLAFVVLVALLATLSTSVEMGLLIANVAATLLVDLAMAVYYGQGRSVTAGLTLSAYRGAGLLTIPVLVFTNSLAATAAVLFGATVAVSIPPLVRLRSHLRNEQDCQQPVSELLRRASSLWQRGAPLAMWAGLDAAVARGDVSILGFLATTVDTGQYVAGSTVMLGFSSVGMAICYVLLPALSRQDEARADETLRRLLVIILPGLLVVALSLAVLAPWLVGLLYGSTSEYNDAAGFFRILILFLPFVVGGRCLQIALVARGRERVVLVTQLLGGGTMAVGCTLGYLIAGATGVALATGLAHVVIATSAALALRWRSINVDENRTFKPVV